MHHAAKQQNVLENLSHQILSSYDLLSRSERKLADLLLEDPDRAVLNTAVELSKASGVSNSTTARFFKRLGYASFRAAQKVLRARASKPTTRAPVPEAPSGATIAEHLENDVQNLVRSIEATRTDLLDDAAKSLARAEKIWVVGFGENYPLAHFARALLIRIKPDIRMIPIGGFSVAEEFSSISEADTMIALGVGRRSRSLRILMRAALSKNAEVIYFTDQLARAGPELATVTLRCRTKAPGIYQSFSAPISLITYLCSMVARRLGETALGRMEAIEGLHHSWAEDLPGEI
ncbi:MAG: MurR/RpiR family transcriptional regulator [Pseudomonadota bacterium]